MRNAIALERVRVPAWSWLVVMTAVFAAYLVSLDNGVALGRLATAAHELFHDGRHMLGVPCH